LQVGISGRRPSLSTKLDPRPDQSVPFPPYSAAHDGHHRGTPRVPRWCQTRVSEAQRSHRSRQQQLFAAQPGQICERQPRRGRITYQTRSKSRPGRSRTTQAQRLQPCQDFGNRYGTARYFSTLTGTSLHTVLTADHRFVTLCRDVCPGLLGSSCTRYGRRQGEGLCA